MAKPPAPGGRKSRMPVDQERGERLKALLADWEIEEFSRKSGIGRTTLYGYMRGNRIGGQNLAKLSETLGVSREEILTGRQPGEAAEADEVSTRDLLRQILAGQQELTATALRVERLLRDQRGHEQPGTRRRSAGE